MSEVTVFVEGTLTLKELGSNPNNYPEEVVAAGLSIIKDMEAQLKEYKQNITANMLRRMEKDNATKLPFIDAKGAERMLTVKKGSMKLNPDIKDYDKYIEKAGFIPADLGRMLFTPLPWKDMKEKRKQGGDIQLLIDELYKEGQPSLTIE